MQSRTIAQEDYRFGFNGKENDGETYGIGNALDFGARIYDSRLGRFFSVDPSTRKFPGQSPYVFAANNPITFMENGNEPIPRFTAYEKGDWFAFGGITSTDYKWNQVGKKMYEFAPFPGGFFISIINAYDDNNKQHPTYLDPKGTKTEEMKHDVGKSIAQEAPGLIWENMWKIVGDGAEVIGEVGGKISNVVGISLTAFDIIQTVSMPADYDAILVGYTFSILQSEYGVTRALGNTSTYMLANNPNKNGPDGNYSFKSADDYANTANIIYTNLAIHFSKYLDSEGKITSYSIDLMDNEFGKGGFKYEFKNSVEAQKQNHTTK